MSLLQTSLLVLKIVGIVTLLSMTAGLSWEHIAKKNKSDFKPSVFVWKIVPYAENTWYWIGEQFARLSSFLTYIKDLLQAMWNWIQDFFSGFLDTIIDLFTPIVAFLFSWTKFFEGYADTITTYSYYGLVLIGSIVLLFVLFIVAALVLVKFEYIDSMYSPYHQIKQWWYADQEVQQDPGNREASRSVTRGTSTRSNQ